MPGRIFPAALFRHGVVAPAAQRIAPGDAPCRQQQPFDAAVGADGLDAVLAAGGRKAAVPPQPRADELLVEPDENYHEGAIREMYEETGLKLDPIPVAEAYQKPYFTTVGMTDESCATVYGYASGEISSKAQEDTEEIEVILADREEVKRILKEENVAIMTAYMLMHFLEDKEPFGFLNKIR